MITQGYFLQNLRILFELLLVLFLLGILIHEYKPSQEKPFNDSAFSRQFRSCQLRDSESDVQEIKRFLEEDDR